MNRLLGTRPESWARRIVTSSFAFGLAGTAFLGLFGCGAVKTDAATKESGQCQGFVPFSKAGDTPTESVSDLIDAAQGYAKTLQRRALVAGGTLNIAPDDGLVTNIRSDEPEVRASDTDLILSFPTRSGSDHREVIFTLDEPNGNFRIAIGAIACTAPAEGSRDQLFPTVVFASLQGYVEATNALG